MPVPSETVHRSIVAESPRSFFGALCPLTDMTRGESYEGEDGGLYGGGKNDPPASHLAAAIRHAASVQPLDATGKPNEHGLIGLLAIGFSNTFHEFREFEGLTGPDPQVASAVRPVNGAQLRVGLAKWVGTESSGANPNLDPWQALDERLTQSGVAGPQIQAAWIKLTPGVPAALGEFPVHVEEMTRDLRTVLRRLATRFPNLQLAFLSSRVFGGYAVTRLSPEPYAYESAFSVRRLIQEQIRGDACLNCDSARGPVRSPLLLWGPYLWSRGEGGRQTDDLAWARDDFGADGTHPSAAGARKVAHQLLAFMKTDSAARPWFVA